MKPTKCPAWGKKRDKKSEKRGKERNRKVKVKTAVSLLNPCVSTACDIISFKGHGQLVAANLCKVKRSFKPYQNEHNSVKDTEKKAKNHVTLTWKSPWKSCSIAHLPFLSPNPKILKAFLKTLPTKMKPTKCPAREKNEARKAKKEGRREREKYSAGQN